MMASLFDSSVNGYCHAEGRGADRNRRPPHPAAAAAAAAWPPDLPGGQSHPAGPAEAPQTALVIQHQVASSGPQPTNAPQGTETAASQRLHQTDAQQTGNPLSSSSTFPGTRSLPNASSVQQPGETSRRQPQEQVSMPPRQMAAARGGAMGQHARSPAAPADNSMPPLPALQGHLPTRDGKSSSREQVAAGPGISESQRGQNSQRQRVQQPAFNMHRPQDRASNPGQRLHDPEWAMRTRTEEAADLQG